MRTGKGDIYEGGVRIPTILYAPNTLAKAKRVDEPIISMDYYPTLMELAGISSEKIKAQTVDGKSMVSLIKETENERESVYWHYPHYHQEGGVPYSAIRDGNWKLIENFETNTFELYNLKNDISEQINLIDSEPEKVEALKIKLSKWRDEVGAQYATPNNKFDKKRERKKRVNN